MTQMCLKICFFVILTASVSYVPLSPAQEDPQEPPPVEQWDDLDGVESWVLEQLSRGGNRLSDVLFETLNDLPLYRSEIGNVEIDLSVHRRIFENHDALNSWTVVDRFNVAGSLPIYSKMIDAAGSASQNFGFTIGTRAGIEFINIHQSTPDSYVSLPTLDAQKEKIESSAWYDEFISTPTTSSEDTPSSGVWLPTTNDNGDPVLGFFGADSFLDSENEARYSRFWNLILFPFRLPIKAGLIRNMDIGEIISYVGQGALELGPSVGWSFDPTGVIGAGGAHVSYTTFISGAFRISIYREDEHRVRVKATRSRSLGHAINIGESHSTDLLSGNLIVDKLNDGIKIVPFSLSVGESSTRSFDVAYRFDLRDPAAAEAYEQSVMGRLALADELSIDLAGHPRQGTGVEKLFTRTSDTDSTSQSRRLQLGFIFKKRSQTSITHVETTITVPGPNGDETHHLFRSLTENSSDWKLLWAVYEKFMTRFGLFLDVDQYEQDPVSNSAVTLTVEGSIKDSDTFKDEMMDYILEIEDAVGKYGIFPRPPASADKGAMKSTTEAAPDFHFGKSRFYYRFDLTQDQIHKFIETDSSDMWRVIENAFGAPRYFWTNPFIRALYQLLTLPLSILNIPLYVTDVNIRQGSDLLHARIIHYKWAAIKDMPTIREKVEALGSLFYDRLFSYEMVRIIRSALDNEDVGFIVSGYNMLFGSLYDQGNTHILANNRASEIEREIEFDQQGPRYPDTSAVVGNLSVNPLSAALVDINFDLNSTPKGLFLQLYTDNPWWYFHNSKLGDILLFNAGQYSPGRNTLVLDKNDTQSPLYELAGQLEPDSGYKVRLSINNNGLHWGMAAENTFVTPEE